MKKPYRLMLRLPAELAETIQILRASMPGDRTMTSLMIEAAQDFVKKHEREHLDRAA